MRVTAPDLHVGPIGVGLPGAIDAGASVTFEIAARTQGLLSTRACGQLELAPIDLSATNVQVHGENLIGDVALFTASVIKFFSGDDFLKGLTDNHLIQLPGIATTCRTPTGGRAEP